MRTILFHGTGSSPDSYWLPYTKVGLERRGYVVNVPALPNPYNPVLEDCLKVALALPYDSDTILIGHSSGAALILSLLEKIDVKVKQAILIAGFFEPLDPPKPEPMVQAKYDWEKIKNHCADFYFINSDNDPWACNDKVGRAMLDKLGGTLVIPKGEGHMGSTTFNQPYKEFPLLLKLIG